MSEGSKQNVDGLSAEIALLKAKVEILESTIKTLASFSSNALTAMNGLREEAEEIRENFDKLTATLSDFGASYVETVDSVERNSNDLAFLSVFTYYLAVNVDEADVLKGDIARTTIEDAEKSNVDIDFTHYGIFLNLKS